MVMLTQKSLLLAKIETVQNTDALPTALADGILIFNPTFSNKVTFIERSLVSDDLSPYASIVGQQLATVSFDVEIRGIGTGPAGSAPPWAMKLLPACGMVGQAIAAGEGGSNPAQYVFNPTSDSVDSPMKSATIYVFYDGMLQKVTGAMGTWALTGQAGGIAKISFTFTGVYAGTVDEALPDSAFTFTDPIPPTVQLANLTFGDSTDLVVDTFKVDIGNQVQERTDVNGPQGLHGVRVTTRTPTGTLDPEAVPEGTHPFWADQSGGVLNSLALRIGQVSGNRMTITCPKVQTTGISYQDRKGIRAYNLTINPRRNNGNDELQFLFD
jgi:hypothetical protein